MPEINNKTSIGMRISELLDLQYKLHQEISELKEILDSKHEEMNNIQQELNSLADVIKAPQVNDSTMSFLTDHDRGTDRKEIKMNTTQPPKGIVTHMIKIMKESGVPMKADLIFEKIVKIRPDTKNSSVRAYLSNSDYFQNIKLKDIMAGTTPYKSAGWVLSQKGKSIEL